MLQLSKAFGGRLGLWKTKQNDPSKRLLSNVVKNQRSKAKGYDLRNTENTHVEKNGVSTTMKMSTKGPNEDYARLSCQHKERPQLVCQKRISNRFVHLPRCALSSLFLGLQAWYSLWLGRLCIFFSFSFVLFFLILSPFSPLLCYYVSFCIWPHTLTFRRQVHNA